MAAPGEVLFQRGKNGEEENNVWDDTALIRAYDEAVSQVKMKLAERSVGDAAENEPSQEVTTKPAANKKQKKNKGKKHGKKERPASSASKWKAGDHCRAVFTEDGTIYEAVIKSINHQFGTGLVRYLGYGNEEEHMLEDLLPPGDTAPIQDNVSEQQSDNDSMDWASPRAPSVSSSTTPGRSRGRGSRGANTPPPWCQPPTFPAMPPMPPPGGAFPMMPPMFPPAMPSLPGWPYSSTTGIPQIPPPPPMMDDQPPEGDNEALYSMLIAWYMSGYHTGYYQGLKQGRKDGDKEPNRGRKGQPR